MGNYQMVAFGKTWKSIRQCCDHYGLCYQSVMQYKSDYKCDTESAIKHYRERSMFTFRKKKWDSIKKCCEYYGINYRSFIVCKKNWNMSTEEALKYYLNNNHSFVFNGVTYRSFTDCCHAYDVNPISVKKYGKQHKLMERRALIGYLKQKEKKAFCFAGYSYESFTACCKVYHLKAPLLREYAKRQNVSLYDAMIHYILLGKASGNMKILKPITYDGIYYQTLVLCCEALSLDLEQVCEKENIEKTMKMARKRDPLLIQGFCYQNKYYPSIGVCCKQLGLKENLVYSRLWREKSLESVLNFFNEKKRSLNDNKKRYKE